MERETVCAASGARAGWRVLAVVALVTGGLWTAAGLASFRAPLPGPSPDRLVAAAQPVTTSEPTRSSRDGVYTAEQARRGRRIYQMYCADCHKPSEFMRGYQTAYEIFSSRSEMPQSSPGALSAQEYADLIAYVFEAGGMPAGKEELKGDPAILKQVRIDAKEPSAR